MEAEQVHATLLDRKGSGREMTWPEVEAWHPGQGVLWLHFDRAEEAVVQWIRTDSGLAQIVVEALLARPMRPRTLRVNDGLFLALCGVDPKHKSRREDRVSIRVWVEENRVISTGKRRLLAEEDLIARLESGCGPRGAAALVVSLADLLVLRMSDRAEEFEEGVDDLEDQLLERGGEGLGVNLVQFRKRTIALRRYLCLQREVLSRMQQEAMPWFDEESHALLGDVNERLQRNIDDIDTVRERAAIAQEEILSRNSDQLNSRMYVLSVVAAIFLPLGFLTSLFGINVGGIPWEESAGGFIAFCVLLVVALAGQLVFFHWKKWL
ncbi:zinc transporter ZntB [Microbulbifer sp. 2205BS26-8]|uniref:zinc transporter ZntB n=1 Tax=Microbulbifer sp. 2205BS26-8 TaxID=3064386 RepID=UPI00273F9BB7|nr:zinc transporter ZntB [Microbulbifer sp. 2205BS26-8]MDP5209139.1 zinc transporter ZntB [Microbulbifer sp. 2205BS26-8]